MLKIRREQVAALDEEMARRFHATAAQMLATQYPGRVPPAHVERLAWVKESIARGEEHGLRTEDEMHAFLAARIVLGEEFDQQLPWARTVLRDPAFTPEERASVLRHFISENGAAA